MTSRIGIVGAGIAGLAAAQALTAQGVSVQVFDKARGAGGRLSTRRSEHGAFDHGAQYFTCRDPRFERVLRSWLEQGAVRRWNASLVSVKAGARQPEPAPSERFVGVPGMSAVGRALADGLDVSLRRRAVRVEPEESTWRVAFEEGEDAGPFDAVLVATPAPQAVPLLAACPALAAEVERVTMEPCHAAMVTFATPLDVAFDGAFVEGSPLAWIARNGSKPERAVPDTWVLHTMPAWSEAHLEAEASQLETDVLEALAEALGAALPPVVHVQVHRWLYARTRQALGKPWLWEPDAGLGACGDWTYGGRVENAYLSGLELATEILGAS
ncbi:MAG: FAD-dependent oxidoreductase [Myxococcota bacterium]